MSEQLGYMPHLSTLMHTINLVNAYLLLRLIEAFWSGSEIWNAVVGVLCLFAINMNYLKVNLCTSNKLIRLCPTFFCRSFCVCLLLIIISGVEAGKKAAGEVLALQKRVLAVLNEARYNIKSSCNLGLYYYFHFYLS